MSIQIYDNGDMVSMYLEWFNNFLTVGRFAEYYGITEAFANRIIKSGRDLVNNQHYNGPIHKVTVKVG